MNIETMPGDAEYLGAVHGMAETYGGTGILRDGHLVSSYVVGDRIQWIDARGITRRGVVVEVLTDDTYHVRSHVPDLGNVHYTVREDQTRTG